MTKRAGAPGPRGERGVMSARIVEAARAEFAEHGAAGTTIRSVARVADVDPALIYHYFGSKAGLLDAATSPPRRWLEQVAVMWSDVPRAELGRRLLQNLLDSWADTEIGPTLRAVLLAAAHEPATRERLRAIIEHTLIGESTVGANEDDRLKRSGLITSQLLGLAMMRYVWKIEPIASMSARTIADAMSPNLQHYVDDDLSASAPPRRM